MQFGVSRLSGSTKDSKSEALTGDFLDSGVGPRSRELIEFSPRFWNTVGFGLVRKRMKPIQPVGFATKVCSGVGKFPAGVTSRHGNGPTFFTCATPDGGIRREAGALDAA